MRLLLILGSLIYVADSSLREDEFSTKTKNFKLSPQQIKRVEQMHYGWYVQAISALLGAIGKEVYMKMSRRNRKAFIACLDSIDNEHDIKNGAECLVKAFDGKLVRYSVKLPVFQITYFPEAAYSPQFDFVENKNEMPETKLTTKGIKFKNEMRTILRKRTLKSFLRHQKMAHRPPQLRRPVRIPMGNRSKERRFRRSILSLYTNDEIKKEARRVDKMDSPWKIRTMRHAPALKDTPAHKSPVKAVTDLLRGVVRLVKNQTTGQQKTLRDSYKKLTELQDMVTNRNRDGQFKHRMLDMVLGKNHPLRRKKTFTEKFQDIVPEGIVDRNLYGLVETVAKHQKDVNYSLLSPRFFPLLPDKYSNKKPILSPNLFALYHDDTGNSILPVPEMLEKAGMRKQDRTNVLELIMDASGVNEVVDDAMELVKNLGASGFGKDILDITKAVDSAFLDLKQSFSKRQKRDISNKQYAFLDKDQLKQLYGSQGELTRSIVIRVQGIYNNSNVHFPFDIEQYGNWTYKQKKDSLKRTVRLLAKNGAPRVKRTIEVRILRHTTLAPFAFSPTVGVFNILGPLTLSPNIFSPSVIAPLLLSPPIISPQVGDPLILSPYFLGPNTISAAVFNAYILSPYVLSPNVINPYVLSPLILSPYVLCPDVLSPTILSGAILSPSVASPAIFTESALAAAVLSPSIFS